MQGRGAPVVPVVERREIVSSASSSNPGLTPQSMLLPIGARLPLYLVGLGRAGDPLGVNRPRFSATHTPTVSTVLANDEAAILLYFYHRTKDPEFVPLVIKFMKFGCDNFQSTTSSPRLGDTAIYRSS